MNITHLIYVMACLIPVFPVRHARSVNGELRRISAMEPCELFSYAKLHGVPIDLVQQVCVRVHCIDRGSVALMIVSLVCPGEGARRQITSGEFRRRWYCYPCRRSINDAVGMQCVANAA